MENFMEKFATGLSNAQLGDIAVDLINDKPALQIAGRLDVPVEDVFAFAARVVCDSAKVNPYPHITPAEQAAIIADYLTGVQQRANVPRPAVQSRASSGKQRRSKITEELRATIIADLETQPADVSATRHHQALADKHGLGVASIYRIDQARRADLSNGSTAEAQIPTEKAQTLTANQPVAADTEPRWVCRRLINRSYAARFRVARLA
jgi:transposase-like protein